MLNQRFSKLPDDADPWAPNNLRKSGAKEKHQLNPGAPINIHSRSSAQDQLK